MGTNAYEYGYDLIGNRRLALSNAIACVYAANELNQYASVTNAGAGVPVAYDADGNMTRNGGWYYAWDAENNMRRAGVLGMSNGIVRVDCGYDFMKRRFSKRVSVLTGYEPPSGDPPVPGNPGVWVPRATTYYVWNGWNVAAEIRIDETAGTTNVLRYVWGLDLSGSLQGAGGVGGLLAVADGNGSAYYPAYDANGNVTEYVDGSGAVRGHFEYSPFGETTAQSGDLADRFTHRFSTKPFDAETGLSKYQQRDYIPPLGRWASRDPIEEDGGANLFLFANNSAVTTYDCFGNKVVSLSIRGEGPSKIDEAAWRSNFEGAYVAVAMSDNKLGYHGGFGTYQPSSPWWSFSKKPSPVAIAVGLFKFEYEVEQECPYIDPYNKQAGNYKNFSIKQFVSNGYRGWRDEKGNWDEDALTTLKGEHFDGPTLVDIKNDDVGKRVIQFAGDAPRTPYPYGGNKWPVNGGAYQYYFGATWRVRAEDNDNAWEGVFRVIYQFNSTSPSLGKGQLIVIVPPHEVK